MNSKDFGITPFSCLPSKIFHNKNGFFIRIFLQIFHNENNKLTVTHVLTDDAWVSGPDLAPQKFLLSQ